jgi:hypothetical protein
MRYRLGSPPARRRLSSGYREYGLRLYSSTEQTEKRRRSQETCGEARVERRQGCLWEKLGVSSRLPRHAGFMSLVRQWYRCRNAGLSAMDRRGVPFSRGIFD